MFMVTDASAQGLFGGGQSGGTGSGPNMLLYLLQFVPLILIFYLLLIRPQQQQAKKTRQMLAALKRGDKVITSGGLMGTIVGIDDHKVTLRVAEKVDMEFLRTAVTGVVPEGQKS